MTDCVLHTRKGVGRVVRHWRDKGKGIRMDAMVLSSFAQYGEDMGAFEDQRKRIDGWVSMGLAYVWGRQDAGDLHAKRVDSFEFANVYMLACVVTHGCFEPLQAAFHEFVETGRVLVRTRRGVATVQIVKANGSSRAECLMLPWAGPEFLRYWPGLPAARKVCMEKHNA